MLLSRRILIGNLLLLLGLLALGMAPLWGLFRVQDQVQVAVDEYTELRLLQRAALHLALARTHMACDNPDSAEVTTELNAAADVLREYVGYQDEVMEGSATHESLEKTLGANALESVKQALATYAAPDQANSAERIAENLKLLNASSEDLNRLATEADKLVGATHSRAARSVRTTTVAVALLGCVVIVMGLLIGVRQYQHIMRPLSRLRHAVRTVASGGLRTRVPENGDTEFTELACDFNRMAHELDSLYRGLEEKVATKSRELVQSERLASVGFLAAGVAHEINNPLNIISGYCELSLRRLRRSTSPDAVNDAMETLQIIRDEAFRCKQITEKLLSLSTPADGTREPLSIRHATEDVIAVLQHLKRFQDRKFTLRLDDAGDLEVMANENEIKQVLLNLMVNAVEATEPNVGEICTQIGRQDGWVRLSVNDNGHGMTPEICQRVFEPFFSGKRGDGGRGIGLGLSISHAIVVNHSGRLSAHSDGPGRGSRFTMELPCCGAGVRS
jgi:signal transduction histidine kinase